MNKAYPTKNISTVAATALVVAFLLLMSFLAALYGLKEQTRYVHKTCKDFSTYKEAERDYRNGNTSLDGNGDGIPCNNLLR